MANFIIPKVTDEEISALPTPANYNLLVKPLEVEEKTTSGIYLPDAHVKEKEYLVSAGVVVAMGPTCFQAEAFGNQAPCELGDVVFFGRHNGNRFEVNGHKYVLLIDDRVMMTYKKEDADKIKKFAAVI